ncbi:MAG: DsbC family protein [Thiothrix sp.]|nr:DsbC family protein [Thiothrix sp.]HPE59811.1 DsbC family protein [Thiolinea sp.]
MYKKILLLGAVIGSLLMAGVSQADENVAQTLSAKLKPLFGEVPDAVNTTPIPGVYEAVFGTEMIYVSADGRYFISGDMIDGQSRKNLSENARAAARKAELVAAGEEKTIDFKAKGDEKYVLSVFTDVDCPFCEKLHTEVPKLNELGVTVRYYAYPRAGIGSNTYKKMVSVWCAEDQQDAMTKVKSGQTIEEKTCDNPVADDYALGQKVGVTGTPALIAGNGTLIPGYRPANDLFSMLESMSN